MTENPHLTRLAGEPGRHAHNISFGCLFVWLWSSLGIIAGGFLRYPNSFVVFSMIGIVLLVVYLLGGLYLAWFTARHAAGQQFDLLRLTLLSNRQIVWGYLWGALRRFQNITGVPLAFLIPLSLLSSCFTMLSASARYRLPFERISAEMDYLMFNLSIGLAALAVLSLPTGLLIGLVIRQVNGAVFMTLGVLATYLLLWGFLQVRFVEISTVFSVPQMVIALAILLLSVGIFECSVRIVRWQAML